MYKETEDHMQRGRGLCLLTYQLVSGGVKSTVGAGKATGEAVEQTGREDNVDFIWGKIWE